MEDEALLSRLGVTAAKAEDVERRVIENIEQQTANAATDEAPEEDQDSAALGENETQRARILSQLRTLQKEIDAVKGGLELTEADGFLQKEDGEQKERKITRRSSVHAQLTCDRLKSLGHKRKQLRSQLKSLDEGKPQVTFSEDTSFDAALNAAAGLIETDRDRLIRIGALTPFDKLHGYERRVKRVKSQSGAVEGQHESVTNAIASLASIAQARPTTKLLDSAELPKAERPTVEFRHLRKRKAVDTSRQDGNQEGKRKKKRPRPDAKWKVNDSLAGEVEDNEEGEYEEVLLEGGLKVPSEIYDKLFDYQKTGLKWMWELHCQNAGGIIGDEMGLGKTVQVIGFLASLHHSRMYKTSIVICPVTLLNQWKREVQKWYPKFDVEIIHDASNKPKAAKQRDSDSSEYDSDEAKKKPPKWDKTIKHAAKSSSGLILTSYGQLRANRDILLSIKWGYTVLDEGHKIKNPDADITLMCKQLQTCHRLIMTGAPIQNKLTELWSLFDFVFPGKLGVLPVFQAQFSVPISSGGYANATPLQVSTAYKCAVALRDLIMPYLLRRMKCDVEAKLTKKTEHVLFCSLTEEQRAAYRAFLASSEVEGIVQGTRNLLSGIDVLRKICNHPDLLEREQSENDPDYGKPERSGKLLVVSQVLSLWKSQGNKVLIFCQTQQMLDIVENFVGSENYVYRRMDGSTAVKQRTVIMDEFNGSADVFVLLLTTKVGGLGTNLTGANRVIIFDPDWNPSTDMQARERAWRIGQTKDVTVYRLITRGTIEEKVYHRQIAKQFLTDKILRDPQQKRIFKSRDMRDLFVLQEDANSDKTETSALFADMEIKLGNEEHKECGGLVKEREGVAEEARILESLFQANGIHSAMDHDAILSANDPERRKLEEEASRVAERAAQAIQMSRMSRLKDDVAVPTWTGNSGSAGKRRFGACVNPRLLSCSSEGSAGAFSGKAVSSSEVLARMRERQRADIHSDQGKLLCSQLRDFLAGNGGSASSSTLIEHFKSKLSQDEVPLFKQLLKEVATLENHGGEKSWFVKT